MNTSALRLRLVLIAAPVAHGCSGSPSAPSSATPTTTVNVPVASVAPATSMEIPHGSLRPAGSSSARAPGPLVWLDGSMVCTSAVHTTRDASPTAEAAAFGCGDGLADDVQAAAHELPRTCTYCYDAFAPTGTQQARAMHPDACCYAPIQPSKGRPFVVERGEREAPLVRDRVGWSA